MPEIRITCLHDSHVALGAKMEEFAGFDMPIVYTTIKDEHLAVRNNVGMFDVSHMGEIEVRGKDAIKFVDHVFTNEILSKPFGKVIYGFMLYETGTVVDDLLVYLVNEENVFLVVNASNVAKDYAWLVEQTEGFDVTVINRSDEYGEIALQGPKAEETMKHLFGLDLSGLGFFTFGRFLIDGCEFLISRTGYTGEDGFEIYGSPLDIPPLWNALLEEGVTPCGLGARDTLRFEAALPLYGHEISDRITPVTAGLKFFARVEEKPEFIGREKLLEEIENGSAKSVVGIELTDRGIPRQGYPVFLGEEEVGVITTGYLSISLEKPIAMALVDKKAAKKGTEITVEIRKKHYHGIVRDKKFLKKNYKNN